ncbi:Endonuclease/exonuclease/phosphatase [Pholiota molesta]|nr:Endonuclease/exonuclease/phosphatase [Pholiota molesta]
MDAHVSEAQGTFEKQTTAKVIQEQPFYEFNQDAGKWESKAPQALNQTSTISGAASFTVVTWNVDFMKPYQAQRLTAILSHLQHTVVDPLSSSPERHSPAHIVVLLQEFHYNCFPALLEHPMVRASFALTSVSTATWAHRDARYGVVTLISRTLTPMVAKVFRNPFANTTMAREALYVDLRVHPEKVVRIANTHLESLSGPSDQMRQKQLASVAEFLHAPEVHGGLVGGDMNPIGPLDGCLPERLGLVDAWTATRESSVPGTEGQQRKDQEEDHTWGYQPPSRYPRRRMDKVLLAGNLEAKGMERVGVGLKVSVPSSKNKTESVWASDHYGLVAKIHVA